MTQDAGPATAFRPEGPGVRVVAGNDAAVAEWVRRRLPGATGFGPSTTLHVVEGGAIIAGVVYHDYLGHDIKMTIAALSPRWALRGVIRALLHYPFRELDCARVSAIAARRNRTSRKLLLGLGFKLEGVARKGFDGVQDAMIYGLLRADARRWIGEDNGQECSQDSAAT